MLAGLVVTERNVQLTRVPHQSTDHPQALLGDGVRGAAQARYHQIPCAVHGKIVAISGRP
jgi:hypothetical protein